MTTARPMYCLKCKTYTNTKDQESVFTKNGRPMLKGYCYDCGSAKRMFIKAEKKEA